jgi:hypothetical protein
VAAHRAGLHRAQPAPQETAGGDVAAGSMLANTAKLVALRKVASRARLATGGARKAGRALMRRALTTVL